MNSFITLNLHAGKIGFAGSVRGGDEAGHEAFWIELPRRPLMYGEWKSAWTDERNGFNAEIISFGYLSKNNIGNRHPQARQQLSVEEIAAVRSLILSLFGNDQAREGVFPFSIRESAYLGDVVFLPGWVAHPQSQ